MPSRFLNNITVNDEYTLPSADGTANQVITTDGAGQLSFVDQSTITAGNAEHIVIYAKNTSGSQIDKGTPVYITGTVGATDTVQIAPADAGNASHMPAVGLLDDTLINNAFGYVITGGFMDNITTDPIDGATPSSNDTVYVKVGGGLTLTKPTGPTGLIQNVAKVGKVSGGNSGSLIVSSILRTNDVPNLPTGKIWVGDGNTTVSDVVYLDEANGRMGIGNTSPSYKLDVSGAGRFTDELRIEGSTPNKLYLKSNQEVGNTYLSFYNSSDVLKGFMGYSGVSNDTFNIYQGMGRPIDFYTNASQVMRINNGGNVSIGNTNNTYKLDVSGTGRFTDTLTVQGTGNSSFAGNVGIGTTSPTTKLHVLGTTSSMPSLGAAASAAQIGGLSYGTLFSTLLSGRGVIQQGRSDGIATSYDLLLQPVGGNVGIGNASASYKLDVSGTGRFTDDLNIVAVTPRLKLTDGTSTFLLSTNTSGEGIIKTEGTSKNIRFFNNSGETVRINGGGNVSIGNTNNTYKLDVSGTGRFTSDLFAGKVGIGVTTIAGRTTTAAGVSGYPVLGANTNSALSEHGAYTSYGMNFTVHGAGKAAIQVQRFDTLNNVYDLLLQPNGGNVGIGTFGPNRDLVVSDATNAHLKILSYTAVAEAQLTFATINSDTLYEKSAIIASGSGSWGRHNMHFCVNNAASSANVTLSDSRMMIDYATGNVGIGTTSPGAKLEVEQSNSGTDTVFLSDSYNNKGFRTGNAGYATFSGYQDANNIGSGGAYGALIGLNTFYNGTSFYNDNQYVDPSSILFKDGNILFYTNDISASGNFTPNERLRITKAGNVGIGTTSPSEKLDVNGDVNSDFYRSNSDISTSTVAFNATNTTGGNLNYTVTNNRLICTGSFTASANGLLEIAVLPVGARPNIDRKAFVFPSASSQPLIIQSDGVIKTQLKSGALYEVDFEITLDLTQV